MTDDQTLPIEPSLPAPIAAVSTPVASMGRAPGSNRLRWVVALVVAGLAVALSIGAVLLFASPSSPTALQYIPSDAAIVAELRLDLPGDQMQNLGTLLANFPGFKDQSTLTGKLDEALGRLVEMGAGVGGGVDYGTDVKPWLAGAAFLGVLNLGSSLSAATPSEVMISATTNGAVTCEAALEQQGPLTHETYLNLDLVLSAGGEMACVIDGRQALLGDPATVRKGLDAKAAGTGMDKDKNYAAARTALGGDRLSTVYMRGASFQQLMPTSADLGVPGLSGLIGGLPDWIIAGVRAEADALVFDYVGAPVPAPTVGPSLLPVPATHASLITQMVPGDTLAFMEVQGAGVALKNLLTMVQEVPELAPALQMLDGLGGPGELVGWIDDVGIAVSVHGTTPDAALLLVATDETAAATRVASLKALIGLAGLGDGIEIKESTINGVAVTTVTITDLGAIIPPGSIPGLDDIPAMGTISFSVAANGRTLIVTSGEAAMTAILATAAGSSLANSAAFKHASLRGLASSRTTVYLAVGAGMDLVKGFLPPEALAQFNAEAAPYLDPVEAFLLQATSDATANRSRMVITVTQP